MWRRASEETSQVGRISGIGRQSPTFRQRNIRSREHSNLNIQCVHKVPIQFQKFTKATDEISLSGLFYVLSSYQGFYHIALQGTLLMNKILLNEPLTKWLLLKRR